MKDLNFLQNLDFTLEMTPWKTLLKARDHEIPSRAGIYILKASGNTKFIYPSGESSIFYIGQSSNLKQRIRTHVTFTEEAILNRKLKLYYPRYEYGAKFNAQYSWAAYSDMSPQLLEDELFAVFSDEYRSFPVANSGGGWSKING